MVNPIAKSKLKIMEWELKEKIRVNCLSCLALFNPLTPSILEASVSVLSFPKKLLKVSMGKSRLKANGNKAQSSVLELPWKTKLI